MTRGKIELRIELVDVAEVMTRAVETSRPLFEAAGHVLQVQMPAEALLLAADPLRLAQALSNLLNNAAKYTEPGGQMTLRASREQREAVISVCDNGVGMAADQLDHVFDLFVQAEGSRARAHGGLGIGLTLVR
ncbi:MAG: sensor histidine kinase [Luteimonas sp.]